MCGIKFRSSNGIRYEIRIKGMSNYNHCQSLQKGKRNFKMSMILCQSHETFVQDDTIRVHCFVVVAESRDVTLKLHIL